MTDHYPPMKTLENTTDAAAGSGSVHRLVREFLDARLQDCMELMAGYPDGHFDLAIVDPPYGIGVSGEGKMTSNSRKEYARKNWDDAVPPPEYFAELRRVSKNQIIWGANFFDGVGICGGGIVWNKLGKNIGRREPMPNLSDCEIAYCSSRNNVKMFSYTQIGNVVGNDYRVDWNQQRIHPTQKPVALYEWLLDNYAETGWRILDTHMGSGSIAIACHYARLHLTACEIDEDYFKAACARIERETAQESFIFPNAQDD
jgi:site-specific DNA-methyltransferase (adenine-specific)